MNGPKKSGELQSLREGAAQTPQKRAALRFGRAGLLLLFSGAASAADMSAVNWAGGFLEIFVTVVLAFELGVRHGSAAAALLVLSAGLCLSLGFLTQPPEAAWLLTAAGLVVLLCAVVIGGRRKR